MWLRTPNITSIHGFSTRYGGVSPAPFDSLNLGGSDDLPENISENRQRALKALNLDNSSLCLLKQVHGTHVCEAQPGLQEGDAMVTTRKKLVLAVAIADCYPVLLEDSENGVVGAVHAGWRGVAGHIVRNTIREMESRGARRELLRAAVGQGISKKNFEVGDEVLARFQEEGFPAELMTGNKIDLVGCILSELEREGVSSARVWTMNRCTFENDFYSHRRDKGKTGRMWGLISIQ